MFLFGMTPETVLNLLWIGVVNASLSVWWIREVSHRRAPHTRVRLKHGIAVLAATLALFPCLSASDDLVSLQQLPAIWQSTYAESIAESHSSHSHASYFLAQLLEVLSNFQATTSRGVSPTLRYIPLVHPYGFHPQGLLTPAATGRAPPSDTLA
jgi:hypothetical protein